MIVLLLLAGCDQASWCERFNLACDLDPDPVHETVVDLDGDVWPAGEDCDDLDPETHPTAEEVCDGYDNDCDAEVDEGTTGMRTWYYDEDGDGFGVEELSIVSCEKPPGYELAEGDCEPLDDQVYPGRPEICGNGRDEDCETESSPCGLERPLGVGEATGFVSAVHGSAAFPSAVVAVGGTTDPGWIYFGDPTWPEGGGVWGTRLSSLATSRDGLSVAFLETKLSAAVSGSEAGTALAAVATPAGTAALAVGAPGATVQEEQEGVVYLMEGLRPTGLIEAESPAWLTGAGPGRRLGAALVDLGDTDGDGVADLAVGAPGDRDGAGSVGVFRGPIDRSQELADAWSWVRGEEGIAGLGQVLAAGDVDGDGLGDLLLANPARGPGSVWIAFGPLDSGVLDLADLAVRIDGATDGDALGAALGAGDLDGDGIPDLVAGAPGTADSAGAVYVFAGGETVHARAGRLSVDQARSRLDGSAAGDRAGAALHAGGDLDGDRRTDLVVGAPGVLLGLEGVDTGGVELPAGAAYVITTASSGNRSLGVSDGVIRGEPGAGIGGAGMITIVPDADDNGLAELVLGAPGHGLGRAWVFLPETE
ncbi:hypothetical protein L6R53_06025 [Myxococcota bacterium]|nr:hypothetical protein [Myxococcota bacterium]